MSEVFSLLVAQMITAYLVNLVAFASFYFLVMDVAKGIDLQYDSSVLAKHHINLKTPASLAAFLYTFNAYSLACWYFGWGPMLLYLVLGPLVLLCLRRGLSESAATRVLTSSAVAWLSLSALLTLLMPLQDPMMSLPWVLFSFGFVYSSIIRRQRKFLRNLGISAIRFLLYLFLVGLGSAWWFLPFSYELQAASTRVPDMSSTTFLSGGSSSVLELLRLIGEASGFYEAGRVPGAEYLLGVVPTAIGFTLVIFACTALFSNNRISRSLSVFLGLVLVSSLFVLKGLNQPLGNLNLWLYENILFFQALRAPWHKIEFFFIFSISFLLFLASASFLRRFRVSLKGRHLPVAEIFLLSILLVNSAPLITGSVFASHGYPIYGHSGLESRVIHPYTGALPDDYRKLVSYLNSQPEIFNIMVLPFSPFYAAFTWGYAGGWNILTQTLNKPIIDVNIGYWGYNSSILRIIQRALYRIHMDPHPAVGAALAQYFNVKYVVILGDWDFDFIESGWGGWSKSSSEIARSLSMSGFILERTFGMVYIFRNEYWTEDTTFTAANGILTLKSDLRVEINADAALEYMMWFAIDKKGVALVSSSEEMSEIPASITVNDTIRAAQFGGTNEYISGGNVVVSLPNQLTIHLWMYINSSRTGYMIPISQGSYPNQYWTLQIEPGSGDSRTLTFIIQFQNIASVTVPTERFFMYDAVVSNESVSVYIDGELACRTNTTVGISTSDNQPLFIGRRVEGTYFSGYIINLQIYNEALSSDDISAFSINGLYGAPFLHEKLLLWYPLNETMDDTVPDLSGMGYEGTNHNLVWRPVRVPDIRCWSISEESTLRENKVTISYLKVSDSKWIVRINATGPFVLIFSQTFHSDWHASYGDDPFQKHLNGIPEKLHYFASGYANAWYINRTGDFDITIYFLPETALQLGTIVSLATVLLCVTLVLRVSIGTKQRHLNLATIPCE
jgi:hypothetical protein